MIDYWKHILTRNWSLKLFSLLLAAMLWMTIASESTSEIGIAVPLEYRNIPARTEVLGDGIHTVEVRLRGPSTLLKEVSIQDISIAVDLARMEQGVEKIVPLAEQNVEAPFGVEVVRIVPARVRLTLEPTVVKVLPISATLTGEPAEGEVLAWTARPERIAVEGPASRIEQLEQVMTTAIELAGKAEGFEQPVDLDIDDPLVRVLDSAPVVVQVRIGEQPH